MVEEDFPNLPMLQTFKDLSLAQKAYEAFMDSRYIEITRKHQLRHHDSLPPHLKTVKLLVTETPGKHSDLFYVM